MAPRGPLSDLWVVVVTMSECSNAEGITWPHHATTPQHHANDHQMWTSAQAASPSQHKDVTVTVVIGAAYAKALARGHVLPANLGRNEPRDVSDVGQQVGVVLVGDLMRKHQGTSG